MTNSIMGILQTESPINGLQPPDKQDTSLLLSRRASMAKRMASNVGQSILLLVTSLSAFAVLLIFVFIIKDAYPFFRDQGFVEFFTSIRWYPSNQNPEFGAFAIIYGSLMVTTGAALFAVPLGITAAVCLSDVLPFGLRQYVKPVIEMLASIPSVAYGFFALVVLAPLLQDSGGTILAASVFIVGLPFGTLVAILAAEILAALFQEPMRHTLRWPILVIMGVLGMGIVSLAAYWISGLEITSGTNALNVSLILGVMVLPTVVSVSEDALQAVGRELREASYALGATRAETLLRVVIPAASSGICAAVILGIMRAVGETMVVWMASGNAAQIPSPWFNFLDPVRTLTATIAGDMGEADHMTGSARYHVLFAMALLLLTISFLCNMASEWAVRRERRKLRGA